MPVRRLTAFIAALAITLPLFAFREKLPPPSMAAKVVAEMNRERAAHGLKPLRINDA